MIAMYTKKSIHHTFSNCLRNTASFMFVVFLLVGCNATELPGPMYSADQTLPAGQGASPSPSPSPSATASGNPVSPNLPKAVPLTYVAIVGVTLPISGSLILSANAESSLSLGAPGKPSNSGQVTVSGGDYEFTSNVPGNSSFSYSIVDASGNSASSTITVNVLTSDKVAGTFYATDDKGDIYVLNNSGALDLALSVKLNGATLAFDDLGIDSNGTLYGKSYNASAGTNAIYSVDGSTGNVTVVTSNLIPTSSTSLAGLTFLPDGKIVTAITTSHVDGVAGPVSLVTVDLNTHAVTTLVPQSAGYQMFGGDVKYLPDGNLYWTVAKSPGSKCGSNGDQDIVRVNPASGAVTEVGCTGQSGLYGLGYVYGEIIGFSGSGNLLNINLTNAQTSMISSTGKSFAGGASNPVLWDVLGN